MAEIVMHDPTAEFLRQPGYLVLDGGLATELEAQGADLDSELWSASVLLSEPERLYRVHREFLMAGADCVATGSYQASRMGLAKAGLSLSQVDQTLTRSVSIAIAARDDFWRDERNRAGRRRPLVAASIGPYGAALADGAEYRGDYEIGIDGLVDFHRHRWHVLASSGADLMACETIPSLPEIRVLKGLIEEGSGPPSWIGMSCRDAVTLADGTPLADAVGELVGTRNLVAVGVNCVPPDLVSGLVETIGSCWSGPIVVYPNSGEGWDPQARTWTPAGSSTDPFADATDWYDRGARLIGGCCRTRPAQIEGLRRRLGQHLKRRTH